MYHQEIMNLVFPLTVPLQMKTFDASELAVCVNSHIAKRCFLTLISCDPPYYVCYRCNAVAKYKPGKLLRTTYT